MYINQLMQKYIIVLRKENEVLEGSHEIWRGSYEYIIDYFKGRVCTRAPLTLWKKINEADEMYFIEIGTGKIILCNS